MFDVLYNTLIYLLFIALGYLIKQKKILDGNAVDVLMFLIINFTLPCALLNGSSGIEMNTGVVIYIVIGFAVDILMIIVSLLAFRKRDPLRKGVYLLSTSGIDVGNFVLPFIITFYPGPGMIILSAFNIGNTMMNCGFNYMVAAKVSARESYGPVGLAKKLFSSVIFDTYIVIFIMALLHLELPERVTQITSVPAQANIFLVMVMIGMKLELRFSKEDKKDALTILALRLFGGAILAAVIWALPIEKLAKVIITCALFGPPASASNLFSKKLGYNGSITSQLNVICIFTAMVIITGLLMFFAAMGLGS